MSATVPTMSSSLISQPEPSWVPVPHDAVGCLIGEQGTNIRRLQEQTRCRVRVSDGVCVADTDESRAVVGPQGKVRWVNIKPSGSTVAEGAVALCRRTLEILGQLHMERCQNRKDRTTCLASFLNVAGDEDNASQDVLDAALQQAGAEQDAQQMLEDAAEQKRADAAYSDLLCRRLMMEWSGRFSEASVRQAIAVAGLDVDVAVDWLLNHGCDALREPLPQCDKDEKKQAKFQKAGKKQAKTAELLPALPTRGASKPRQAHALSVIGRRAPEDTYRDDFWAKRAARSSRAHCTGRAVALREIESGRKDGASTQAMIFVY